MPKCKNDNSKTYKGTEPSPKGLGYCAHAEKVGTRTLGNDGFLWIVTKTKNGVKRWTKDPINDCSKLVVYQKLQKHSKHKIIVGLLVGLQYLPGLVHRFISINNFEKKPTKIPKNYKKKRISKNMILKLYCNKNKKLLKSNNLLYKKIMNKHKNARTYLIHDNYSRPFIVYVTKLNGVHVYMVNENHYLNEKDYDKKWSYTQPIINIKKAKKIFIGKSPKTPQTIFSASYGRAFNGNSILVNTSANKYIFIGNEIYEFTTNGDEIVEFISPVGNNDVPYPVAIGKHNVYFMLDQKYVPITRFNTFNQKVKNDAYSYFYGHHKDVAALENKAIRMKHVKLIQKRL